MAIDFQVTIDCADPGKLAEFWALALGYVQEPPPPGFATWEEWLEKNNVPREAWNSRAALIDPDGIRPRLWFQQVPESKVVKNRWHLDLRAGTRGMSPAEREERVRAMSARLEQAGATVLYELREFGGFHITMADPEGNEFCVD